jgi:hypothetical protein
VNDASYETPAIPPVVEANSLYECNNTYQLINFYHATINYLVISTLVEAINKGYLKGFVSLTLRRVQQHIKVKNKTEKSHIDQSCQGKRSTKTSSPAGVPPPFPPNGKPIDTMEPLPQEPFNAHMHFVFMTIIEISGMLISNLSDRFPITSNRGNKYVVIFYIYDANFVKSFPIKSQLKKELLLAYRLVYAYLTARVFKPQLQKMDNETSQDVKTFICKENTCFQYTPPDIHRTNPAEREICTWKNHFLSGIAGLPKTSPIANWCRLTNLTYFVLNMLQLCRQNPAYQRLRHSKGSTLLMQHQWLC